MIPDCTVRSLRYAGPVYSISRSIQRRFLCALRARITILFSAAIPDACSPAGSAPVSCRLGKTSLVRIIGPPAVSFLSLIRKANPSSCGIRRPVFILTSRILPGLSGLPAVLLVLTVVPAGAACLAPPRRIAGIVGAGTLASPRRPLASLPGLTALTCGYGPLLSCSVRTVLPGRGAVLSCPFILSLPGAGLILV
jgi:hypothetical protein